MADGLSRTGVDRLGERLRRGDLTEADLRLLDTYRRSFAEPYSRVIAVLRDRFQLEPTGRPAKSTKSIVDKLRRETVRLSQIQDIAGCRIVTPDAVSQDRLTDEIAAQFDDVAVVDRRERPSHGYRAVHVIVSLEGRTVEIQIRTALQHLWAELSEKLSDRLGIEVKYGGGPSDSRGMLDRASALIGDVDLLDRQLFELNRRIREIVAHPELELTLAAVRTAHRAIGRTARLVLEQALAALSTPPSNQ